jgi:acyl-CoA thioester hydrolase
MGNQGAFLARVVSGHRGVCVLIRLDSMESQEKVLEQGYSESPVRVRYAETDQMGVVYHANYLVWFEIGRVDFIRQMGLDYRLMEQEDGAMIAVVEATARYKAPARYDDELIVRTSLAGARGPIVRFRYAVVRVSDDLLLCEGETTHIVVGRDMKKRDMPPKYAELFAKLAHRMVKKD